MCRSTTHMSLCVLLRRHQKPAIGRTWNSVILKSRTWWHRLNTEREPGLVLRAAHLGWLAFETWWCRYERLWLLVGFLAAAVSLPPLAAGWCLRASLEYLAPDAVGYVLYFITAPVVGDPNEQPRLPGEPAPA